MAISTISSKGQVTIPKKIRERYQLEAGDKIEFLEDEQGVVTLWLVTQSVTRLKGMIQKPEKPVSLEEMKQAIVDEGGKV